LDAVRPSLVDLACTERPIQTNGVGHFFIMFIERGEKKNIFFFEKKLFYSFKSF
jgi:hypothetical protein